MAIENSILRYENEYLREAFIEEKRRHKWGKAIDLIDKKKPGEAQFYSFSKVEVARKRIIAEKTTKEQENT